MAVSTSIFVIFVILLFHEEPPSPSQETWVPVLTAIT